MEPAPIESPCRKVCVLDAASGHCRGCGRSLDEIARWTAIADAERRSIIAALPARMQRLGFAPAAAHG